MAKQFKTKYGNNVRVVSGLAVIVQQDDSFLQVDTSSGPCEILLLDIPNENWDTQYKLFITDISNNATTNNITIKTAVADTINTLTQVQINTNSGGAIIRTLGANKYSGTLNLDERVKISLTDTTHNFLADKISAGSNITLTTLNAGANEQLEITASGGGMGTDEKVKISAADTTENYLSAKIAGGTGISLSISNIGANENLIITSTDVAVISLSHAALLVEITNATIVPDQLYNITDAELTDGGAYITGLTNSTLTLEATGVFQNIDYQLANPTTAPDYIGVWDSTLPFLTIGVSYVNWNGFAYLNLTGANGVTSPDTDAVNWSLLDKPTNPTYYVTEIDDILYDYNNNFLLCRIDKRMNIIWRYYDFKIPIWSIKSFCWGSDKVRNNVVLSNSYFDCINFNSTLGGSLTTNIVSSSSKFDANNTKGTYSNNTITIGSQISATNHAGTLANNVVEAISTIDVNDSTSSLIDNIIEQGAIINGRESLLCQVTDNVLCGSDCEIHIFSADQLVVNYNKISGNTSHILATNAVNGQIVGNILDQASYIECANAGATALISTNILSSGSSIKADACMGNITLNTLEKNAIINANITFKPIECNFNHLGYNCVLNIDNSTATSIMSLNKLTNSSTINADANSGSIINNTLHNNSHINSSANSGTWKYNELHNNSTFTCNTQTGTIGQWSDAKLGNYLNDSTATLTTNSDDVSGLFMTQRGRLTIITNTAAIAGLKIQAANLTLTTNAVILRDNSIVFRSINVASFSATQQGRGSYESSNNWETTLDLSDVAIHSGTTLTLSSSHQSFGIFNLINAAGRKIDAVIGLPNSCYPLTFINADNTGTINLDAFNVAGALINQLISTSLNGLSHTITGRAGDNGDSFQLQRNVFAGNPQIVQVNEIL